MNETYDVVVVGGGPAGMMAAGRAAESGARVLLLEKNAELGVKLLITGGGRCNVTNAEFDIQELTGKYGRKGKFLFSALSQFDSKSTIGFFQALGVPIKIEAEKRAFPQSNKAQSIFDALVAYMKKGGVKVRFNATVTGFEVSNGTVTGVKLGKEIVPAKSVILATGGKSRPETGSTGEGFRWLSTIGHTVIEPDLALVPIKINEGWVKELQGLPLSDAKISVMQDGVMQESRSGKMLFTHFGISGPLALNMSRAIREYEEYGNVHLMLDLFPSRNEAELDRDLQESWKLSQNKKFKNSLSPFIAPKLAPVITKLAGIDPEKYVNIVTRAERLAIIKLMKGLKMTVKGFLGTDRAIVTSGGLRLEEVNFKTMQSKIFPSLYVAGDVLDFDRPSGGFSLQICWTTGFVAGQSAAAART